MMLSRPRNIVMVCSVVVFCAAVMGCSSSGDGAPADMTVEMPPEEMPPEEMPPEEQPPAPPMPSEEDLGLMAAVHTMTEENWSGNLQGEPGWSSDAATWWVGHRKYGAVFHAAPWINPDGELEFYAAPGTFPGEGNEVQTTPVAVHPGRYIDTTKIGNEQPGVTTTVRALEDSRLGADWQGLQATKVYDGGGMLRVDFYTDADASDNLAQPNVRDDFQHEITLDDILPLPADRDYSFFNLPEEGLPGTLDNVAGHFTCAPGTPSGCDFGTTPIRDRYSPLTNDIIFTPDDGSPVTRITGNKPHPVAAADYLSFGNWRYIPEDRAEMHAYEVGLFATVGEPFDAGNLMALSGTAEYAGGAVGIYSVNDDSDDMTQTVRNITDEFTANVELSADFGSDADFGAISGRVFNIALESGNPSPLMEIELSSRRWNDESGVQNIFPRHTWEESDALYHGGVIVGQNPGPEGWWVEWGGMFGGNGDAATDHPSSFAGAFTATWRDDELHRAESIAASFGAHKEP